MRITSECHRGKASLDPFRALSAAESCRSKKADVHTVPGSDPGQLRLSFHPGRMLPVCGRGTFAALASYMRPLRYRCACAAAAG